MSSNAAGSDLRGRAALAVLGCMVAQMTMGCVYLRGPLTPPMLDDLGFSRGDFALASSPQSWMVALASPLVGGLVQRFGARPIVGATIVWMALMFLGFSQLQGLWQLFGLSIGLGLMVAGVGDIAVGTVAARWVSRGRGLALGIVYSGSNLGGFIVALVGGFLLELVGWRATFAWVGVVGAALLLPTVLLMMREPPPDYVPPSAGTRAQEVHGSSEGLTLREALRTRSFWLLGFALILFYFYFMGVSAHLTLYLRDLGLSMRSVSAHFGLTVLMGVAAKLGIGLVADRWPPKAALLVNFSFVVLASVLLLAVARSPGLLIPFVVTHGVATMAQNVVYPLILAHCFGTRYMAQIYGVLMLALLAGTAGGIFAGYVYDSWQSYSGAFQTFALLNVAALAALAAVRREIPAPDAAAAAQTAPAAR
jgi:MFS family permease